VDALRDKIVALLPQPPAADAVMVYDGPDPSRAFAPRAVTVAAAFEDDQDAVAVERIESGARPTVREVMAVACSVYAGGGDVDVEAHRATAGQILTAIDHGLRADRMLGGAVSMARLVSAAWLQGRDSKGAGVAIGFIVQLVVLS
jgi:hypothetical protein